MQIFGKIKMFIQLFFSVNKNLFFEKYKFINVKDKNKLKFYTGWFIFKNYILILAGLIIIDRGLHIGEANIILLALMLLANLLKIDALDWKLFNRNDYILAIPEYSLRCIVILLGNVIYNLIISENIFVYIGLLCYYLRLSPIHFIVITLSYIAVYIFISIVYFLLNNSTLRIKKLYSIVNYVFSFTITTVIFYGILKLIIDLFGMLITKRGEADVIEIIFKNGENAIGFLWQWAANNRLILILGGVVFFIGALISLKISFVYLNHYSYRLAAENSYISNNFIILSAMKKVIKCLCHRDKKREKMLLKEMSLFASIYKYNFKDYLFIFLFDRPVAILFGMLILITSYDIVNVNVLYMCLFTVFLMLDINSAVSVKTIANMSFVSDYNTLVLLNCNGIDINGLLKNKLWFFYIVKGFSYIIYFIGFNVFMVNQKAELIVILLTNVLCILILIFMPRNYLINNLIYTRINYRDFNKYLEESQILEGGVNEFIPINLYFKAAGIATMAVAAVLVILPFVNVKVSISVVIAAVCGVLIIGLIACTYMMNRIGKNIVSFIERGDYSANFAKIFK